MITNIKKLKEPKCMATFLVDILVSFQATMTFAASKFQNAMRKSTQAITRVVAVMIRAIE